MNLIDRIDQGLALRRPQKVALQRLDTAFATIPDIRGSLVDIAARIAGDFPTFERFDTMFPSFCFHIATAVGKTRLMGACIAYLYETKGWRNFFILTKGSTVYRKTIDNFTPGHAKYVLHGYPHLPNIALITGDNYKRTVVSDRLQPERQRLLGSFVNIFVFNVEKLFDDQQTRRLFHTFEETLGGSMADLLTAQNDLVLLMDESHRYRATESMQVINTLKPVVGLEFTATPKSTNIIYRYSLGQAIQDAINHLDDPGQPSGYIKVPVVLGRRDMHATGTAFEDIQLQDGIARHRQKKAQLEVYCANYGLPTLVPIVLISTKHIDHAKEVRQKVESNDFFGGNYKGKVIVTHSRTGELTERDIEGLLTLETPENTIEIVIHVNRLREGWDVKNVYTIIPLRAAKSDILAEQTIGRGMRLPFGKQTGDEDLDTLEIAAHDHFATIVTEARSQVVKTGIPIPVRTREVTQRDREVREARTIRPLPSSSSYHMSVPRLQATYRSRGVLHDFPIRPSQAFSDIDMTLVGTRIGQTEQRDFQVESYTMQEDPVRYLVRVVFDKCHQISSSDENDLRLVPKLIRQYLTHLNTDETTWKQYVQAHAPEMIDDIKDQISAHVVEETEITWADTGEAVTWSSWKKSVPQGYTPPHFSTVSARESRRQLLTGYTKTIYTEAEFDSTQEKLLADILERDSTITSWLRLPTGQMPILYAGGEYNPDFIADDGTTMYLLEIKSAAEVTDSRVQRKASAARDWCRVAATVSGRPWMYKLIPHDDLLATDSFTGVISKSYNLPEPVAGSPEPTTSTNPEEDETGTQASPPPHTE